MVLSATVQQIVYARHPERWHALADALGFTAPYSPRLAASSKPSAYARTIRISDPAVWINGVQTDLYGYHREVRTG